VETIYHYLARSPERATAVIDIIIKEHSVTNPTHIAQDGANVHVCAPFFAPYFVTPGSDQESPYPLLVMM